MNLKTAHPSFERKLPLKPDVANERWAEPKQQLETSWQR